MRKGIVLHDAFQVRGGGERVALALCDGLGLDLAYGYRSSPAAITLAEPGAQLIDLQSWGRLNLPLLGTAGQMLSFRYRTKFLRDYQTVVYSGVTAPLAVRNHVRGKNILYCHTPPRFMYDLREHYFSTLPLWRRIVLRAHIAALQPLYEDAVRAMNVIVANSRAVQHRIQRYLGLPSQIVYPPCDLELFRWRGQQNYYLSTARLDPLKRIDRIVAAFTRMPDKQLLIASEGPQEQRLKALAKGSDNIRITGWINDEKLGEVIGNAIATIYVPQEEDFGISPLESMAAGKPVIATAAGGILETVIDGVTGVFVPADPTPEHIVDAVCALTPQAAYAMRGACEQQAAKFGRQIFLRRMAELL